MDELCSLLGYPCDKRKSGDFLASMCVLGAQVTFDLAKTMVKTVVDETNAVKWKGILATSKLEGSMESPIAEKMAGRLQSAVGISQSNCGRAFVRPFYAQTYAPLRWNSALLSLSIDWWIQYLTVRPPALSFLLSDHREVWLWTDASGLERGLGAVSMHKQGDAWIFRSTSMVLPETIWNQLVARGDNQIGYQEFAAVAMGFETLICDSDVVLSFIDNEGVLSAILNATSRAPEVNIGVGNFWLYLADRNIFNYSARVESKANISDEPSRFIFDNLRHLGPQIVAPRLPKWMYSVWRW